MHIADLVQAQRSFYDHGKTRNFCISCSGFGASRAGNARSRACRFLRALRQDLGKSNMEGYMTELGLTYSELRYIAAHMTRWATKNGCQHR